MRSLAITAENFENQRQTAKEERRQSYDNRPYMNSILRINELAYGDYWPMSLTGTRVLLSLVAVAAVGGGCARRSSTIPGTRIADDRFNRDVLAAVEAYRLAVEKGDAEALFLMAWCAACLPRPPDSGDSEDRYRPAAAARRARARARTTPRAAWSGSANPRPAC